jgi:hypothetical protein
VARRFYRRATFLSSRFYRRPTFCRATFLSSRLYRRSIFFRATFFVVPSLSPIDLFPRHFFDPKIGAKE